MCCRAEQGLAVGRRQWGCKVERSPPSAAPTLFSSLAAARAAHYMVVHKLQESEPVAPHAPPASEKYGLVPCTTSTSAVPSPMRARAVGAQEQNRRQAFQSQTSSTGREQATRKQNGSPAAGRTGKAPTLIQRRCVLACIPSQTVHVAARQNGM